MTLTTPCTCPLQAKKSVYDHLSTIADYAIEMFDVLDEINYQSYNEFVLRVGTSALVRSLQRDRKVCTNRNPCCIHWFAVF